MIFWRKNKNAQEQEQENADDQLLHPRNEPELEPPTEYETDIDPETEHELEETENEILDELDLTPVPQHTPLEDARTHEEEIAHDREEEGGGWLSRLTQGLSKSSQKISQGLGDLITKRKLDQDTLDQLEELLISADLGPVTAAKVVADFSEGRFNKELEENEIREALAESIAKILEPVAKPLDLPEKSGAPHVILVSGVNGVGKTTTIGKLAAWMHFQNHKKVMIAAGDTFRAAAIEQLEVWAERARCAFVSREPGSDAAAVAYEAFEKAAAEGTDILLVDTAGRLHNKANLMAELEKIIRVLKKKDEIAPHEVLLVLDATTGQNAHAQVETYKDILNITGLIVTKLDGSARGGVVVGLADKFGLPIYAVGVGEGIEDLQPFHPREFARTLVGL